MTKLHTCSSQFVIAKQIFFKKTKWLTPWVSKRHAAVDLGGFCFVVFILILRDLWTEVISGRSPLSLLFYCAVWFIHNPGTQKDFFFLLNPLYYPVRAELQVHSKAVWILNNLHSSYKQYDSALICLCKVFYRNNTFPADRLIHWSKVVPAFSPPKYCMVSEYNVSNRILL